MNYTKHTTLAAQVEVADTPHTRRIGLLGRDGLSDGDAMLITKARSIHTVGMQFPIDVVFVDRDGNVVKTAQGVGQGLHVQCPKADAVVELPAGMIIRSRTVAGDRLVIQ
jgi:uncharacterized protein